MDRQNVVCISEAINRYAEAGLHMSACLLAPGPVDPVFGQVKSPMQFSNKCDVYRNVKLRTVLL